MEYSDVVKIFGLFLHVRFHENFPLETLWHQCWGASQPTSRKVSPWNPIIQQLGGSQSTSRKFSPWNTMKLMLGSITTNFTKSAPLWCTVEASFVKSYMKDELIFNLVQSYVKEIKKLHKQEVHGLWRSAWQLQLVWHWQFSADLCQKLTVAN